MTKLLSLAYKDEAVRSNISSNVNNKTTNGTYYCASTTTVTLRQALQQALLQRQLITTLPLRRRAIRTNDTENHLLQKNGNDDNHNWSQATQTTQRYQLWQ